MVYSLLLLYLSRLGNAIRPTGTIEAESGQLILEQIQSGLKQGKLFFYFDFSTVYTLDEQGLEKFLQGINAVVEGGGEHRISSINHSVQKLFALKGLDTALNLDP
jgi:anti-anti-sigma regulatory factor